MTVFSFHGKKRAACPGRAAYSTMEGDKNAPSTAGFQSK
jgi:hypothetical protein